MKKYFITALVAVTLLATFNSCSKEEQAEPELNPVNNTLSSTPTSETDPVELGQGEVLYPYYELRMFTQVKDKYLRTTPISLTKYKDGSYLKSICDDKITLEFESEGRKKHDKSVIWGISPWVVIKDPPIITVTSVDHVFSIKLSKMVTAFGLEVNTPYKGIKYDITVSYWNNKLNKMLPVAYTQYLHAGEGWIDPPFFGDRGGARLWAVSSKNPFNEIRIQIRKDAAIPATGPFNITFAGFRYTLAN